jgi:transcriptional regulator with XRE-family HTH domain
MSVERSDLVPAEAHVRLTVGKAIRHLRELKGWTQKQLAAKSHVSETNLSLLEHDKVEIGKRRAEQLAAAFGVHPAVIMFPEHEAAEIKRMW